VAADVDREDKEKERMIKRVSLTQGGVQPVHVQLGQFE
jgi:hypothetical protein